jgi:serine/threonine-protein kinase
MPDASAPRPLIADEVDPLDLFREAQQAFGDVLEILELRAASRSRALFLARDRTLRRRVGLRIATDNDNRERRWFERETELMAALDHPVMRPVYAAGYVGGWAYRIVKWIEGESLVDAVGRSPRPIPSVLSLARTLLGGLDYVHTQRIVIRRLAPATVLLDAMERASITDLRYASVLLDVAADDPDESKLPFVAPEVRQGEVGDPGSDVYSAAALLFYAVTGTPPALDPGAIVSPKVTREACPAALERVLLRGMQGHPNDRYLTTVEMIDDLLADLGDFEAPTVSVATDLGSPEDGGAWEKRLRRALGDEYELLAELGSGGFGRVYRVRDLALEREVALKVLHPYLTVDPDVVERFRREAKVAAQIVHPNIANTYDIGGRAGLIWYTMEYVHGRNLGRLVKDEGALPPARVVRIMLDALSALEHAHRRNLVHRDLKPENLLIDDATEVVRIADFGLVIALQVTDGMLGAASQSGTPDFAAPEQLLGERVDHRTDLYSLTLVGFYALTGHLPFGSGSLDAVLAQRAVGNLPELARLKEELPERLLEVLARGAAQDPAARYASAREYAEALREAMPEFGRSGYARPRSSGSA